MIKNQSGNKKVRIPKMFKPFCEYLKLKKLSYIFNEGDRITGEDIEVHGLISMSELKFLIQLCEENKFLMAKSHRGYLLIFPL